MIISEATYENLKDVTQLANILWANYAIEELESILKETIEDEKGVIFIVVEKEKLAGFAQCGLRYDYVEGTNSSPVGYLEGIFIKEEFRKKGYAKKLLKCCEKWSAKKGCGEFASDCELTNDISFKFHLSMGFAEANRIICFKNKYKF
ncbi:MAG: aminoglycoside 6'-N-acetyltransferase [Tissierellaceae bacterium]